MPQSPRCAWLRVNCCFMHRYCAYREYFSAQPEKGNPRSCREFRAGGAYASSCATTTRRRFDSGPRISTASSPLFRQDPVRLPAGRPKYGVIETGATMPAFPFSAPGRPDCRRNNRASRQPTDCRAGHFNEARSLPDMLQFSRSSRDQVMNTNSAMEVLFFLRNRHPCVGRI